MRGRIGNLKKSLFLNYLLIFSILLFLGAIVLNIVIFKDFPALWFYAFCLILGIFELFKSRFFKLDSIFYLGNVVTLIGISGIIFLFTQTQAYSHIYILSSFLLSSFLTFIVCGQKFHLVIAYSLFFVLVFALIYTFSIISLPIFIAILCSFLVLLILIIIVNFIWSWKWVFQNNLMVITNEKWTLT